jgi:hypothetical protein
VRPCSGPLASAPVALELGLLRSGESRSARDEWLHHRTVPPLDPAPHPLPGKCLHVHSGGGEGAHLLARDENGEIGSPVLGEVETDLATRLSHRRHDAFDELIGVLEPREMLDILRISDAVRRHAPHTEVLRARFRLTRQKFSYAGAVVGEGIDAGEPFRDEFLLQPKTRVTLHHKDLRERLPMTIGAEAAEAELHLGA